MNNAYNFFEFWAPYWSFIEDNLLDMVSINKLSNMFVAPVLVVGAGQGILVEQLKNEGLEVDGIDFCPTMIKYAKQRRNIDLINADARSMPFTDNAYQSAIIATGVMDFLDDKKMMTQIINEVKRVTRNKDHIFIAFARMVPQIEKTMRCLGLISEDKIHLKRFAELTRLKPGEFLAKIRKSPNVSTIGAMLSLIKIWLFLPYKDRRLSDNFKKMWQKAQEEKSNMDSLMDSVPDKIPFRGEEHIRDLFAEMEISITDIYTSYSCMVAHLQ